jgi:hypothetical protein
MGNEVNERLEDELKTHAWILKWKKQDIIKEISTWTETLIS